MSILVEPNDDRRGGVGSDHIGGEGGGGSEGVKGGDTSWTTLDDASLCKRASPPPARTLGSSGRVDATEFDLEGKSPSILLKETELCVLGRAARTDL